LKFKIQNSRFKIPGFQAVGRKLYGVSCLSFAGSLGEPLCLCALLAEKEMRGGMRNECEKENKPVLNVWQRVKCMDDGLCSYKRFEVHEIFNLEVDFTVKSYSEQSDTSKIIGH